MSQRPSLSARGSGTGTGKYFAVLGLAALAYVVATWLSPVGDNRFGLSLVQIRLLRSVLVLPVIAIWGLAVFGASRFKAYSRTIKESQDGRALDRLSNGLLVIAAGLIISSLFASLRGWAVGLNLTEGFTITANYLLLVFPLVGFGLMFIGSRQLLRVAAAKRLDPRIWLVLAMLAAIIYVYARGITSNGTTGASYLPPAWLWLTVVVPYILTWLLGAGTIINLGTYQRAVKGIIYRKVLRLLTLGLYVVVSFSIGLQLLALLQGQWQTAGLGWRLVALGLVLAFYGLGYLLIAAGAKRLAKIEAAH